MQLVRFDDRVCGGDICMESDAAAPAAVCHVNVLMQPLLLPASPATAAA
jgi:hypothetical protein